MNDDELYELAKERIANDNGKRYSQEEIMKSSSCYFLSRSNAILILTLRIKISCALRG